MKYTKIFNLRFKISENICGFLEQAKIEKALLFQFL